MDAADWDRRWAEKALHVHGEPSDVVADAVRSLPPGRALDLGCGAGRQAVWLAERGWQVTGVDFSGEALRQAQQRAAERGVEAEWVEADVTQYDAPPDYDLVLVAFLHVPPADWEAVVASAAAAVAPGGNLLLIGHDRAGLDSGAPGPTNPDVLHTVDELVAALPAGLTVGRAEQVRRPVTLDGGREVDAIDALVVATRAA